MRSFKAPDAMVFSLLIILFISAFSINVLADPVLVGTCDTPGEAQAVYVENGLAYVADGSGGLQVIDVSNPSNPSILGSQSTSDRARDVCIAGDYAYVPHANVPPSSTSGLEIIDISIPSSPNSVYNYLTPHKARGIYVSNNYAYLADDESPLQILDISDPINPIQIGGINPAGNNFDIYVRAGYAYVADRQGGLAVIDVSDPSNPSIVDTEATPDQALRVHVSGEYAYVAARESGLQIIDISTPTNPITMGFEDTPGMAYGVFVNGGYAYIADTESGLQIIDISDPANPNTVAGYDTPDYAYDVFVKAGFAYVADRYTGLIILDISDLPPVVGFSANPVAGYAPLTVEFTDESTGDINSWEWNFGDGDTSYDQNPNHAYQVPAAYSVSLAISGVNGGDAEVKDDYISVYEFDYPACDGEIVFMDGFEEGPLENYWFFDMPNWQGTKEYVTSNPHSGNQCLFMKGSDHSPGGASHMRPIQSYDSHSANISFWVRDFSYLTGSGGDGQFAVYIYDKFENHVATLYENQAFGNGYLCLYLAEQVDTIASDIKLAELSGWIPIKIIYISGEASQLVVLFNEQTIIDVAPDTEISPFGSLEIGVGGQYNNTGEIYLDDFAICTYSDFVYLCGDANNDESVNVSDAVYVINYVFIGGNPPDPLESGDANCDSSVNVSDAVWIINYLVSGGSAACETDGDSILDC
jgi:hypothetical protein